MYTKTDKNKTLHCGLCPNNCRIPPEKKGICGVRFNNNGLLELPFYGKISALSLDPIEKKPLYHFFPGKKILSAGFYGCSLQCPFCQNFHISRSFTEEAEKLSPQKLVELALEAKSFGIAYTYSEPLVHYEYVYETCLLARKNGLKNVLITNGYINLEPAETLFPLIDAANIDLKSFNPEFYIKELKGKLDPVLNIITLFHSIIHLEITTLVIPGKNASSEEIEAIASFLSGLSPNIPLHLSCYHPSYQYKIPSTDPSKVLYLAGKAEKYLNYVYPGNMPDRDISTLCPKCGNTAVKRKGYNVYTSGLMGNKCSSCGFVLPIVLL